MPSIHESLLTNKESAAPAGRVGNTELLEFEPPWGEQDLRRVDQMIVEKLQKEFDWEHVISYDDARAMLPSIFSDIGVKTQLSIYTKRRKDPYRISSMGLQLGNYAIQMLHVIEGDRYEIPVVSYIPRVPEPSIFAWQASIDAEILPNVASIFTALPDEVRAHTDINYPIASGAIEWQGERYPVYLSPLDQGRGEISVEPMKYRSGRREIVIPVPTHSLAYTQHMHDANEMQMYLKTLLQDKEFDTVKEIVTQQLLRIAESHAVLAQVTKILPKDMSIDAGDWMGILDPYLMFGNGEVGIPVITHMKLMTLKGGIVSVESESDWITRMRTYTYAYKGKHYALFELLSQKHLHETWEKASHVLSS